jgi:DNA-binding Lrp family transcriptional regulator
MSISKRRRSITNVNTTVSANATLDKLDRELLALLQANARESVTNLGKKLDVARTTVLARMARLEKTGVITGYSVRLDQTALERSLQAYVGLSVQPKAGRDVLKHLSKMPEIKLVCSVSGEFDYVVWLRADAPHALDILLDEIGDIEGVTKTNTSVVLAERISRG